MNRTVVSLTVVLSLAVSRQVVTQPSSPVETSATAEAVLTQPVMQMQPVVPPNPALEAESTARGNEERIRAHHDKVDKIVAENKARQMAEPRISNTIREVEIPEGWIVRVAEGLRSPEADRLMRHLKDDSFESVIVTSDRSTTASPAAAYNTAGYRVLLPYRNKRQAVAAVDRLRSLGYQFGSVRYGRIIEQIKPEREAKMTPNR